MTERTEPYCERLRMRFDEFHDQTLSSFLQQVIKSHLSKCSSCQSYYDEYAVSIQSFQMVDVPDVSPATVKRLIRALKEPGEGGSKLPNILPDIGFDDGLQTT